MELFSRSVLIGQPYFKLIITYGRSHILNIFVHSTSNALVHPHYVYTFLPLHTAKHNEFAALNGQLQVVRKIALDYNYIIVPNHSSTDYNFFALIINFA